MHASAHQPTGADVLLQCLVRHGARTVYAYPGGTALPILQALTRLRGQIRTILPRHEQGGGFAALGQARSTGQVSVCVATSGPGATNLITCLANAQRTALPLLAITGQVQQPRPRHRCLPGNPDHQPVPHDHEASGPGARASQTCRASCVRRCTSPPRADPDRWSWTCRRTCRTRCGTPTSTSRCACPRIVRSPGVSRRHCRISRRTLAVRTRNTSSTVCCGWCACAGNGSRRC